VGALANGGGLVDLADGGEDAVGGTGGENGFVTLGEGLNVFQVVKDDPIKDSEGMGELIGCDPKEARPECKPIEASISDGYVGAKAVGEKSREAEGVIFCTKSYNILF
jgi:hypothetical protein